MSVRLMARVFELPASVSPTQRIVLLKLADCANDEGCNAYPSVATLSRAAGVGERAVQKTLRQLERCGYIRPEKRAHRYRSTTYRLTLPEKWLAELLANRAIAELLADPERRSLVDDMASGRYERTEAA
jgi:DNA-binding MarR family transcriptional regulator